MRKAILFYCLSFGLKLSAQGPDSMRIFSEQERNELKSMVQIGLSGGFLSNKTNQTLVNIQPEISFGGSLRMLLAPSFYWTPWNHADSMKTSYLLAGMAGQHIINGFLIQGKMMTNINRGRSHFQIAAGMGIPLSKKAWFRFEYTVLLEQRSRFSGEMLSAGLLFSLH
jgi:hypothetical protein